MAAKTWDNGGGDGLWSTGANWSDNAVPATNDPLTFDGTSSASCTIDNVGTWTGGTITVTSAYGGNFTQNVPLTFSGTLTIGTSPASNVWTQNATLTGPTLGIGALGTFTRVSGDLLCAVSMNATGVLNLGADARVSGISTNSGSTITGTGAITFVTGTTNLVNGTVWDTSGVTSLLCQGSGVAAHALTIGTSETSLSGVPITVTGSGNFTFTGAAYDFNVVAVTKGGSGGITIASTADVDFGTNPTITCNGITVNGEAIISGTLTYTQLATASPVAFSVGATGIVSGGLTAVNLSGSLTLNATATWPASVVLNINAMRNTDLSITATAHTFGTCTLTGGTDNPTFTIAAGTSITLAADQTSGSTGTVTVTGTLNLLGNLNLSGSMTTSASSTLSGTAIIQLTNGSLTMNATCTVSNTIGWIANFTTASSRTFAGASKTYASFQRTGSGSGQLTVSGSNTFTGAFTDNDGQVAHTILFTASTTQTAAAWNLKGSTGKILTINSTTTTNFVLAMTGGTAVVCSFISVANSTVDAAPIWYAGLTPPSVDGGGGNVNWIFTPPPNSNLYKQQAAIIS